VRRSSAEKLYESLLLYGQLDNHSEIVMTLLAETIWDADIINLMPIVKQISDCLNIPIEF